MSKETYYSVRQVNGLANQPFPFVCACVLCIVCVCCVFCVCVIVCVCVCVCVCACVCVCRLVRATGRASGCASERDLEIEMREGAQDSPEVCQRVANVLLTCC